MTLATTEDFSGAHGHLLPDVDSPRTTFIYGDGCTVVPGDNGSWLYIPADGGPAQSGGVPAATQAAVGPDADDGADAHTEE